MCGCFPTVLSARACFESRLGLPIRRAIPRLQWLVVIYSYCSLEMISQKAPRDK